MRNFELLKKLLAKKINSTLTIIIRDIIITFIIIIIISTQNSITYAIRIQLTASFCLCGSFYNREKNVYTAMKDGKEMKKERKLIFYENCFRVEFV